MEYLDKTGLKVYHRIVKDLIDDSKTDIGVTDQELVTTEDKQQVKIMEFDENDFALSNTKVLTNKHAVSADQIGTATVGSASIPVYLNAGVPTVITSIDSSLIGEITSTDVEALF